MTDESSKPPAPPASDDHSKRVHSAFDDLHATLGDRETPEARETVEKLRAAALERDGDRVRGHLEEVRDRHGWLYEELTAHPGVAALVNELALLGL
jgi:hypothetical protein